MTDFDARVKQVLSEDDEAFLKTLDLEPGLFAQWGQTFQGPMKYWTLVANVVTLVVTIIGLYAAWQFITAPDTRDMLLWAGAAWAAWTMQIGLKQWLHSRMMHTTLLRELKAIELRLVQLKG